MLASVLSSVANDRAFTGCRIFGVRSADKNDWHLRCVGICFSPASWDSSGLHESRHPSNMRCSIGSEAVDQLPFLRRALLCLVVWLRVPASNLNDMLSVPPQLLGKHGPFVVLAACSGDCHGNFKPRFRFAVTMNLHRSTARWVSSGSAEAGLEHSGEDPLCRR